MVLSIFLDSCVIIRIMSYSTFIILQNEYSLSCSDNSLVRKRPQTLLIMRKGPSHSEILIIPFTLLILHNLYILKYL